MKLMIAAASVAMIGAAACDGARKSADNADADETRLAADDSEPVPATAPESDPYDTVPDAAPVDSTPPATPPPTVDETAAETAAITDLPAAMATDTTTDTTTGATAATPATADGDQSLATRVAFQDYLAAQFETADADADASLSRVEYTTVAVALAALAEANDEDTAPAPSSAAATPATVDEAFKKVSGADSRISETEMRTALLADYDAVDADKNGALTESERHALAHRIAFADTPALPVTQ